MPITVDLKKLVWDALVQAATKALFSALPALGWGPIGLLVSTFIGVFADKLYDLAKDYFDSEAILSRNSENRRLFDDSSVKLYVIAKGKGIDSPEFKEARVAHVTRLSNLVRFVD